MPLALPDAAVEVLDAAASRLGSTPARRGVVLAAPAIDCEMLTVHLASLGLVTPIDEGPLASFEPGPRVSMATFVVTLAECVPTGERVKIEKIQDAALRLQADAWAVWLGLLGHDYGACRPVAVTSEALPLPEDGGFAGFLFPITLQVD